MESVIAVVIAAKSAATIVLFSFEKLALFGLFCSCCRRNYFIGAGTTLEGPIGNDTRPVTLEMVNSIPFTATFVADVQLINTF